MPGPPNPIYRTAKWRRLSDKRRKIAAAAGEPCALCGQDIDYQLTGNRQPWAYTADHPHPLALGGDHYPDVHDLRPAHRYCQQKQAGTVTAVTNAARRAVKAPRSQQQANPGTQPPPNVPTPHRPSTGVTVFRTPGGTSAGAPTVLLPEVTGFGGGLSGVGPLVASDAVDDDGVPRFMSPRHPRAVGSLADEWLPWLESEGGIVLRPWQRLVLQRAWEVDAGGRLCWPTVVTSTARQLGKSWLARAGITARCELGGVLWGEFQECLHVANALVAARRIHSRAWRWAEARGIDVRKAFGSERLIWPDESHWSLVAAKSAWGASGSMVFADEGWDIEAEVIDVGLEPTMLERVSPQLWLSSTANDETTSLIPGRRRDALAGSTDILLVEWSTPPDVDEFDPAVWRRWSAFWSPQREEFVARAAGRARAGGQALAAFRSQYLNRWPDVDGPGRREWPPGWSRCGRVVARPPAGGVAALESTVNRSHFGTAYAVADGEGRVGVWSARHDSLGAAVAWLEERRPVRLGVGLSLVSQVAVSMPVEGFGTSHTRLGTPLLEDLVRRGMLVHDHGDAAATQTGNARVMQSDRDGIYLSGKASQGPVETLKAVAWAVLGVSVPAVEEPAIW